MTSFCNISINVSFLKTVDSKIVIISFDQSKESYMSIKNIDAYITIIDDIFYSFKKPYKWYFYDIIDRVCDLIAVLPLIQNHFNQICRWEDLIPIEERLRELADSLLVTYSNAPIVSRLVERDITVLKILVKYLIFFIYSQCTNKQFIHEDKYFCYNSETFEETFNSEERLFLKIVIDPVGNIKKMLEYHGPILPI